MTIEMSFFIHAHNKQTLKPVVDLLRKASIPVCTIADIDILNAQAELLALIKALVPAYDTAKIAELQAKIATAIDGRPENEIRTELAAAVSELNTQLSEGKHTLAGARGALSRIEGATTKWSEAKKKGIEGLPFAKWSEAGELLTTLKSLGLFVVPVGELEGWLDVGTTQKNKWIVPALEAIGEGNASDKLKTFVGEVIGFLYS